MAAAETDIATAHIEARIDVAVGTSVDIAIETDVETRVGMPRIEMPGTRYRASRYRGIEMLTRNPRNGARDGVQRGAPARRSCAHRPQRRAQPVAPGFRDPERCNREHDAAVVHHAGTNSHTINSASSRASMK